VIKNDGMRINNIIQDLNEDIDETTFNMWKSELKKELSSFWESMNRF
jgi:hypothetical protein